MIAHVVVKTALTVAVLAEVATIAVAQAATVDRTAVWVAGLGFCGLIVTSGLTYFGQRAAAREQRDAARELRLAATKQVEKVEEIHDLVNSKSKEQSETIAELTNEIRRLNATALAKAEAAPALPSKETDE